MAHIDVCLALIDACEPAAREVARRIGGDVLRLDSAQIQSSAWLQRANAVAFLGPEVDLAVCKRCIEAGMHVLVAGEACRSRSLLDSLAEHADALLQLGNPLASLPSRRLIWEQFQQGKLGEPGLVRVHRWSAATSEPKSNENKLSPALIYEIDNVLRYVSDSPQQVFATEYAERRGYAVHLSWSSGPMAMIDFVEQLAGANAYASFSVIGSSGSAYADDHPNVQLLIREQTIGLPVPETSHPQLPMILSFLARVSGNGSQAEDLSRWRQTLSIADAMLESLRTRKAVEPKR